MKELMFKCVYCDNNAVVRDLVSDQWACSRHARYYGPCSFSKPNVFQCPCILTCSHFGFCECQHGIKIVRGKAHVVVELD